jgi:TolB-like protein/Flp pilus assembly protein TadD
LPPDRRIEFRVGIHQGDIVVEDGDIFGDGVNVAVRLEGLAEPGSICVSARVQEDAAGRLDLAFEDLGEPPLKNIARPVRAYRVVTVGGPALTRVTTGLAKSLHASIHYDRPDFPARHPARAYVLHPEGTPGSPRAGVSSGGSSPPPVAAPRLSIVVLPFTNLSDDREQQYFADGITEDLTTDLSRLTGMLVISRNTAFTYRNKPVDTKQIGRELGVRYVLEGSVRRWGNQIRVTAQLIDAETEAHLWTERFDHDIGDLFALQNEITSRIAVALNLELCGAEAARPTQRPDALECMIRGCVALVKEASRKGYAEAVGWYERALALDPTSIDAQSWLATILTVRVLNEMTDTAAADLERADKLVIQALRASPRSPNAHYAKGNLLRLGQRYEDAISEYETVLAFNRNSLGALAGLSICKVMTGSIDEAIPLTEHAIRLSPRDPNIAYRYVWIGIAHLLQSRNDEAIVWFEKARRTNPRHANPHIYLASAYALKGDLDSASAELAEALRLGSDGRFLSIARLKAAGISSGGYWGVPKIRALFETTYFAGLRKAGLPEK